MSILRRFVVLVGIYLFALIPIYSILAVLEGRVRGLWHLSASDWISQGSAALVQAGSLFIAGGVVAVPVIAVGTRIFGGTRRGPLASGALAFIAVLICAGLLARGMLLIFPVAFLVSTAAYALSVFQIVRRDDSVARAT